MYDPIRALVSPTSPRLPYLCSVLNIDGLIEPLPSPAHPRTSMIATGPGSITPSNIPPHPHPSLKNPRTPINGTQ